MSQHEFVGRRVCKLVAREFWRSGSLISAVGVVFIEDDRGDGWKVFLDDEDHTWKVKGNSDVPSPQSDARDPEFQWPVKDLLNRFPIAGDVVAGFDEGDRGTTARAALKLASGRELVFEYEYATERSTLKMEVTG
jgi:hypothetical protein